MKCFAAVATSLNNAYPHADRSRNLYNMVIKGMKNTRTPRQQTMEIPEDKIKEASIIDIQLKDLKGNTRSLTDLKGKVVLIDLLYITMQCLLHIIWRYVNFIISMLLKGSRFTRFHWMVMNTFGKHLQIICLGSVYVTLMALILHTFHYIM